MNRLLILWHGLNKKVQNSVSEIEAGGIFSWGKIIFTVDNGSLLDDEVECKLKSAEQVELAKQLSVGGKATIRGQIQYTTDLDLYRILTINIMEIG